MFLKLYFHAIFVLKAQSDDMKKLNKYLLKNDELEKNLFVIAEYAQVSTFFTDRFPSLINLVGN